MSQDPTQPVPPAVPPADAPFGPHLPPPLPALPPAAIPPSYSAEPGYKTTEFWGKVVIQGIGLLTVFGAIHLSSAQNDAILGFSALILPEVGYALSRGGRKRGTPS